MEVATTDQAAWVLRVLGIAPAGATATATTGASASRAWQAARQAWQDANDAVNDQINGLRVAMLAMAKAGDDEQEGLAEALTEIANGGLNVIPDMNRVRLMAALMEVGSGEPATMRQFGAKALAQISAFEAFLASSEQIEVCDANPIGAPVAIRATLTPPLRAMAAALQSGMAQP